MEVCSSPFSLMGCALKASLCFPASTEIFASEILIFQLSVSLSVFCLSTFSRAEVFFFAPCFFIWRAG